MELIKTAINSGNNILDGFKLDDKFVGPEPIPNYLMFEFRGHEEKIFSNFSAVNASGFELELVSLTGGSVMGSNIQIQLHNISVVYQPQETTSAYPRNFVFLSDFGKPTLPFSFSQGILVPNRSQIAISFSAYVAFARLLVKPRLPVLIGPLVSDP